MPTVGYAELAKLVAADAATDDYFGNSVAIDGDTIVVGAWGDDDGGSASGSVYVFRTSDGGAADYGTQFRANNSADSRANRDADDRTYVPTNGTTHIGAVRFAHDRGFDVQSVTAAESCPLGRSDTHPDVRTIGIADHRGTVLSTHDRRAVRVADDQPHVLADVRSVSVADGVP